MIRRLTLAQLYHTNIPNFLLQLPLMILDLVVGLVTTIRLGTILVTIDSWVELVQQIRVVWA